MKLSNSHIQVLNRFISEYNNNLTKEDKIKLANDIINYFMNLDVTDKTKTVYISLAKKYIMSNIDDKYFINLIIPDKEFTKNVKINSIKIRDNKPMIIINNQIINKLFSFKNSKNIYEINIYLLFVTGRRFSELIDAKFYNIKGSKRIIKIDGIKKMRDDDNNKICDIILLDNKTHVLKLIKKFQKDVKKFKFDNYKRNFTRNIKKIMNDDNFIPHTLRGIYALYLYTYNNPTNIRINQYIKNVLCHKNINSSLAYTNIKFEK